MASKRRKEVNEKRSQRSIKLFPILSQRGSVKEEKKKIVGVSYIKMTAWHSGSSNDSIMEQGWDTRSSSELPHRENILTPTGAELHCVTPRRSILRLPLLTLWGWTDCNATTSFTACREA